MNVLMRSGRAVGRMDADGTVWLAMESEDDGSGNGSDDKPVTASRMGRVDDAGCVFGPQEPDGESAETAEHPVGSVDAAGLFWSEGGALRGAFESATGAVRDGDRVIGHVFGPNPERAAAALCFLCPAGADEPSDDSQLDHPDERDASGSAAASGNVAASRAGTASATRERGARPREAGSHEASRQRKARYLAAHLVVVALLIGGAAWGGVALFAAGSKYLRDARAQIRPPVVSTAPSGPAANTHPDEGAETNKPPHESGEASRAAVESANAERASAERASAERASAERTAVVRDALAARYSDIDRAFGSRDAEASVVPFAPEWVYVSTTGAVSDIRAARQYFAERSSGPKRFLSCSLETHISALREGKNGTQVATVNQTVYTEVLRKDGGTRRVRTRIVQEDTWRDDGSLGWRCVRSRLRKQSATRL